jgi:type IV pilus assembly protein PilM
MLKARSFLAADFGAANLKLAEFEVSENGGLLLRQYGLKSMGQDGLQEGTRGPAMVRTLQELLSERGFQAKAVNVCAPGFNTFSKFVKLPPVDTSKVTQIIQYEAQQNVPFPLEEVVWDYQILGATATGELEVLLVAIKTDVVEGLFKVVENAGLRLQLADVSPAALCNAFRYNYGDLAGCTMLLDIGAKTSNLIFFEQGNVYARGINIGAHSITTDFARESRLSFAEAEQIKIDEGFVSLGGAYEEPDNPNQAAISKIARQVMTRLHIQVNQTVQYYRQTQGGSAPDQLFLSGGASVMPYTAQFFAEKLGVPVEYFNPLRNVELDPSLDREELVKVAHSLGEVVGLGLRNLAHCPVELNLMPKSSLRRQSINQKKPYFVAAAFCFALILYAFGFFYENVAGEKERALDQLSAQVTPFERNEATMNRIKRDIAQTQGQMQMYVNWMEDNLYWGRFLADVRAIFIEVEQSMEREFQAINPNARVGVWIARLVPGNAEGPLSMADLPVEEPPKEEASDRPRGAAAANPPAGATREGPPPTLRITHFYLVCRGVDTDGIVPGANNKIAFFLAETLKGRTNLVDPIGTQLYGDLAALKEQRAWEVKMVLKLSTPYEF